MSSPRLGACAEIDHALSVAGPSRAALSQDFAPNEAELRRAVSGAYYGLFHTLIDAGSAIVAGNDEVLKARVSRTYAHEKLRSICSDIRRSHPAQMKEPFRDLFRIPPSPELVEVANAMVELYLARILADYRLSESLTETYAFERVQLARKAADTFQRIRTRAETRVFLAALLVGDRWNQGG